MAKPLATFESVSSAAMGILAEGKEPTLTEVQRRTGGSYTTVKRYLQEWLDQRESEAQSTALPAEVEARGRTFVQGLYAHAVRAANAAVAEPLAQAQDAQKKAEGRLAGAEAEVQRLEAVEQDQAAQLQELGERVRGLEMTLASRDAALAEKSAAAARLEEQLAEAQRAQAAAAREAAELRAAARTHEALQGQMEALQRQIQGLAAGGAARP